jgi:3'-phosphoadenosine 5'-phosphosulfate sulfotransferase (PAPS reductase)/FAD synthetase
MKYVVSISGGKDSTALLLWALNNLTEDSNNEIIPVFCDTGWEHKNTYEYLEYLEKELNIKIIRLQNELGGMREVALHKGFMPNRIMKYCTFELKIKPFKKFIYENFVSKSIDFITLVGVRREESESRADYECFAVVRETYKRKVFYIKRLMPLVYWTEDKVFDYIKDNGLEVNPIYKKGSKRAGCYPCINARKSEIQKLEPEYVKRVRDLEKEISEKIGKKAKFFTSDRDKFMPDRQPSLF